MEIIHQQSRDSRGVLLDIGDTLVPATEIASQALLEAARAVLLESPVPVSITDFLCLYSRVDASHQGPLVNHLYSGISIARDVAYELAVENAIEWSCDFLSEYRSAVRKRIQELPNCVNLVRRLSAHGYRFGVLTDGTSAEQIETLSRIGLLELMDAVVVSEEIGVEKPHPKMFLEALDRLRIEEPGNVVMVGDSLERDILGSQRVGLKAIWFNPERRTAASKIIPDAEIRELSELEWVLDAVFSK